MLFFNRASRKENGTLLRGATQIVGAVTLVGCGIIGSGGSDTASTTYESNELIAASKVDEAKLLVTDVDQVLAFAGTGTDGTDGNAKESDLSVPDCANATKGKKWESAVFFNPNSLRRSVADAQGISRRSGYFSSFDAAREAVSKSLLNKSATGVICLKSARYSFSLLLDKDNASDRWANELTFSGTKSGVQGYQSKISFTVQFSSETIKETVQNATGLIDYHYVSSITLSSENGDEDSWKFAPSKAAKDSIASNLNKYLVQWVKDNPRAKTARKSSSGTSDQSKNFASCDNGKTPRIFANVSAEMSKVFPGVRLSKEQLAAREGSDTKNYVYAEVKLVTDGRPTMKAEEGLEEFRLSQSNLIRLMTYTIPVGTPGRYELHLTPVRDGRRTRNSTVIKFTLRHAKDEYSGNCSARIEKREATDDKNGLVANVNFD